MSFTDKKTLEYYSDKPFKPHSTRAYTKRKWPGTGKEGRSDEEDMVEHPDDLLDERDTEYDPEADPMLEELRGMREDMAKLAKVLVNFCREASLSK